MDSGVAYLLRLDRAPSQPGGPFAVVARGRAARFPTILASRPTSFGTCLLEARPSTINVWGALEDHSYLISLRFTEMSAKADSLQCCGLFLDSDLKTQDVLLPSGAKALSGRARVPAVSCRNVVALVATSRGIAVQGGKAFK